MKISKGRQKILDALRPILTVVLVLYQLNVAEQSFRAVRSVV